MLAIAAVAYLVLPKLTIPLYRFFYRSPYPQMTSGLFAQIHHNPLVGSHTVLKDADLADSLNYLIGFLKTYDKSVPLDLEIKQLKHCYKLTRQLDQIKGKYLFQARKLSRLADRVVKQIDALATGEVLILPAGWCSLSHEVVGNKVEHNILLELQRQADDTLTLKLINVDKTLSNELPYIKGQNSIKHQTVLTYNGVAKADVANREFIQALFELKAQHSYKGNIRDRVLAYALDLNGMGENVTSGISVPMQSDLFNKLFKHFADKLEVPSDNPQDYSRSQYHNTPIKVLLAKVKLKLKLKRPSQYLRFKIEGIKLIRDNFENSPEVNVFAKQLDAKVAAARLIQCRYRFLNATERWNKSSDSETTVNAVKAELQA